ncbi:response regulator [Dyadobacter sandarakinus]|uniref:Response regulator n=1 Tax=Dyadobacter sandarakinus TaxID=2747268 RepID=A0ABX7I3H5_9BACT|nr:response regulator [Dyadobacter sandarakinus]QRR00619.1 response regulator [Dyadobacter sandarakinus]
MQSLIQVFIVDDDIDDQEIFSLIFEGADDRVSCTFANNGLHALDKLANGSVNPHLIFVDINMPKMNGIELLTRLKSQPHLPDTPVYMLSTSAEKNIIEQCISLGATGFIQKQANMDELKTAFINIIQNLASSL